MRTKVTALFLSLFLITGIFPGVAAEPDTITVYVSVSDGENVYLPRTPVTVKEADPGAYGYEIAPEHQAEGYMVLEALIAAHARFFPDSPVKEHLMISDAGYVSVTKLWDIESFNWMFLVNQEPISLSVAQNTVSDGDELDVYFYDANREYGDVTTDKTTVLPGETVAVNVKTLSVWGSMVHPVEGAFINYWDVETEALMPFVLDENGQVSMNPEDMADIVMTDEQGNTQISFSKPGRYLISATAYNGSGEMCLYLPWEEITVRDVVKEQVAAALNQTVAWVKANNKTGDWWIFDLNRAEALEDHTYLSVLEQNITAAYEEKGKLSETATDYHRTILAVLSAGGNPAEVGQYNGKPVNLLQDGVYEPVLNPAKQGVNAYVYGLLALDAANYAVPAEAAYDREDYIEQILAFQSQDGGMGYSKNGVGDIDLTGMTLSALAPYYQSNTQVKAAVDRMLSYLSEEQTQNGGFESWDVENNTSTAAVMTGVTDLGIDCAADSRFIKNDNTMIDYIQSTATGDGSYSYGGESSDFSTDQVLRAYAGYLRMKEGKTPTYRFEEKNIIRLDCLENLENGAAVWDARYQDGVLKSVKKTEAAAGQKSYDAQAGEAGMERILFIWSKDGTMIPYAKGFRL